MSNRPKFFSELDAMDQRLFKTKLVQCKFSKKEILLVQEWIMQKPEVRNYKTWIRHALYPEKTVTIAEAALLYRKGWTDSQNKVFNGIRGKWYRIVIFSRTTLKKFWLDHWKWIIGITVNIVLGLLALYFKCPDK